MSAKVDQFCDNLRGQLNAVEARVESIKANMQSLPGKVEKAVHVKADEVRANLEAQKQRIEKTRSDLKAWAEQKSAATKEAVREWKAKGEAKKLNARADLAEAYAEAAVTIALATIDEAEAAILDAVAARIDADAA